MPDTAAWDPRIVRLEKLWDTARGAAGVAPRARMLPVSGDIETDAYVVELLADGGPICRFIGPRLTSFIGRPVMGDRVDAIFEDRPQYAAVLRHVIASRQPFRQLGESLATYSGGRRVRLQHLAVPVGPGDGAADGVVGVMFGI
jgi:hypothetical protein